MNKGRQSVYPDILFSFVGANKLIWVGVAIFYAFFDYAFNTVFCFITGGLQSIKNTKKVTKTSRANRFLAGGRNRLNEFRSDALSWMWPITVLAIPIALFGITRTHLQITSLSLSQIGINLTTYQLIPYANYIQIALWVIALMVSISTFYRYQFMRSKTTWFSKSFGFNLARTLLFDFPLAYVAINIILLSLSFSAALYRMLADDSIYYYTLHHDQMYGLKVVYNTVVYMSISLILLSFLPTIMIFREKKEKYSKMYKLLIYTGIIVVFILMGLLVFQFSQRLSSIQENALRLPITPFADQTNYNDPVIILTYYNIVTSLPGTFPSPPWLSSLFSVRAVVLAYELFRLFTVGTKDLSVGEIIKSLISKL